ncbi:MAG: hypothetical protein PUB42_06050 [Firmicutes bacterium]|nr:hypothetical protein [Bacillota bacterium]
MIKRLLVILCCLSLLLSAAPAAFAEDITLYSEELPAVTAPGGKTSIVVDEKPTGGMRSKVILESAVLDEHISEISSAYASGGVDFEKSLYDMLYETIKGHKDSLNISSMNIPVSQLETVMDTYLKVLYEHPELMAYTQLGYTQTTEKIINLNPKYLFTSVAEDDKARAVVESGIQYYLDLVADMPKDDIVGKMLVIHDAFVKNNVYAQEELDSYYSKENNNTLTAEDWTIFTAYGLFKNKRAVCQGNSIALAAIYKRLGVEGAFCSNEKKNHIWNCFKVNGKWYYLDETWNDKTVRYTEDGVTKILSGGQHDYFLVSEGKMADHGDESELKFYSDDPDVVKCTDTEFEANHIFNGGGSYNGEFLGGYFGTVSYENSRYKIEIMGQPEMRTGDDGTLQKYMILWNSTPPFYSSCIVSGGILLSDSYNGTDSSSGNTVRLAMYYATDDTENVDILFDLKLNGRQLNVLRGGSKSFSRGAAKVIGFSLDIAGYTLYMWNFDRQKPVSQPRAL